MLIKRNQTLFLVTYLYILYTCTFKLVWTTVFSLKEIFVVELYLSSTLSTFGPLIAPLQAILFIETVKNKWYEGLIDKLLFFLLKLGFPLTSSWQKLLTKISCLLRGYLELAEKWKLSEMWHLEKTDGAVKL